ncbi:GDP-mannose mannosyl hydrolase [Sinimarinibacterium sp. CAU 1509]|uniref:GDP-mannose mannosyl hydrolase n=1 Tax=Sinimarinibacterium sp. CAU 1509 TaxID=2562283 RepID=UPI0010AB6A44|nr:GDP-mannose mannosyl hydrolase [Sinimarinibacterium sp. CAU 1509]TJY65124.1 GDP-mannose mannosyl hydrolase [Sinimarinibacterium sp. CAU 1509]
MADGPLPAAEYLELIARAPLVSIDLIVRDTGGRTLVGMRRNAPAKGYWFVPGGAIRKGETLDHAFARISHTELGQSFARRDAALLGVYDHLYVDNFMGVPGIGTHYVVLAHTLQITTALELPRSQHSEFRWMTPLELREHPQVHANTRAYFETV